MIIKLINHIFSSISMPNDEDYVRITTKESTFEGVLLPRPDILESGITVLKLDSGYNIGIEEKKIVKTEVIKAHKPKKTSKTKIPVNEKLPNVSLLSFGGTISSRVDYTTGGTIADYGAEDFVAMYPELSKIANIKGKMVAQMMSEDMSSEDWALMAEAIAKEANKKDISGVVVTIGTDMLHYISAALTFMLKDLHKPVIITASQRSIDRGSTDAFMNLSCAVSAAAKFDGAVVATCLHGTTNDDYCLLIRGCKVRKMHTSRRDAFRPVNDQALAQITVDGKITITNTNYPKKSDGKIIVESKFEDKIGMIQIYPGISPKLIDFFVENKYKGLIISATALGHIPTGKTSVLPALKRAIKSGMTLIIASQTLYGRTHPYVYTNLRKLSVQLGCIFAADMLPEVAFVKLGWTLKQEKDPIKVKELFLTNLHGEINERISTDSFLN